MISSDPSVLMSEEWFNVLLTPFTVLAQRDDTFNMAISVCVIRFEKMANSLLDISELLTHVCTPYNANWKPS